jgi:hypothetical protein
MFESLAALSDRLSANGHFIDPVMTQVVFLAAKLQKPLLLEGPAGSGNGRNSYSLISQEYLNRLRLTLLLPRQMQLLMPRPSCGRRRPACAKP